MIMMIVMMAMIAMMIMNDKYSSSTNCMDIRRLGPAELLLKSCDHKSLLLGAIVLIGMKYEL